MGDSDWIYITDHAAVRWHERTESPGVGPRAAWLDAKPANPADLTGEEIRYHAPTDTYLIAWGPRLVTVIQANQQPAAADSGVVA